MAINLTPLHKFFFANGHIHVPAYPEYEALFELCNKLRHTRSQLPTGVVDDLDSMGFVWDTNTSNELRWLYQYENLKKFYHEFGHTRVSSRGELKTLGIWVLRQRRDEKKLSAKNKRLLKAIQFEWADDIKEKKAEQWRAMFRKLREFYKKKGHSNVSDSDKQDEQLGRWVSTVRSREDHLEAWKKKLLKTVKFKFSEDIIRDRSKNRERLFQKLRAFYIKNGHANVPEGYRDAELAIFVAYLRQYPQRINAGEKKLLARWKFLFSHEIRNSRERLWLTSFEKLQRFKKRNGHCRVSSIDKDRSLALWVSIQRKAMKKGTLKPEREAKLRKLGFSFYEDIEALHEAKWMKQYEKLIRFKARYGTTRVQESYGDKQLVYWVQHQRRGVGRMMVKRKKLLDGIGFVWRVK